MKQVLLTKNKLKFVNGKISPLASDDPLYEAWERCNVMVLSWIIINLSLEIVKSIICKEDVNKLCGMRVLIVFYQIVPLI
uniref:Retrotransposon Copia-like N-terminal domain-containing protein n=1 Tax=Cajanus cajan TaxID=3821 RepID=A0A151TUE9_CAJCA|nr:hypothetical protein KK1_009851 [Cajanus cajan]